RSRGQSLGSSHACHQDPEPYDREHQRGADRLQPKLLAPVTENERRLRPKEACMIRTGVVLPMGLMMLWPGMLVAQSVERPSEEVQVGDAWVYDNKDGISGLPIGTYTSIVAEISPKEIVTNVIVRGRNDRRLVVFDHDWNRFVL